MKKQCIFNLMSYSSNKEKNEFKMQTKITKKNMVMRFRVQYKKEMQTFKNKANVIQGRKTGIQNVILRKTQIPLLMKADSSNFYITQFKISDPFILKNISRIFHLIRYHVLRFNGMGKETIEDKPENIYAIIKYNSNNLQDEESLEFIKTIESNEIITDYMVQYINRYL